MNVCVKCKYVSIEILHKVPCAAYCTHPSAIDPVWGHTCSPCSKERAGISDLSCGPSGQYFEAKE